MLKRFFLLSVCALLSLTNVHGQSLKEVTVAFTGDIMMGTTYPSVQLPPNQGRQLFVDAAPILTKADVAAGNFEGTLCNGGSTHKVLSKASYAFRTPTTFAPRLREAGYDFLSLANNHAFDFGEQGLLSTMDCLQRLDIAYCGIKGYPPYAILERNGIRFGFCAFGHNSYTLRHQNLSTVRQIITDLVNQVDIVIVSFHGGAEGIKYNRLPYGKETFYNEDRGTLRDFAHFCIDAGADVVYGHGPHVTRAVELYKEHVIAYSLGNFCTPYGMSLGGILGYAPILELTLSIDGRFLNGKIHSFIQRKGVGPRTDTLFRAAREIKRLTVLDMPNSLIEIDEIGNITRKQ